MNGNFGGFFNIRSPDFPIEYSNLLLCVTVLAFS